MNQDLRYSFFWTAAFAVAMALVEADVVVYLRIMFYPEGFQPPIVMLPEFLTLVELGRELATIVMLLAVSFLAGKTGLQRFAWFAFMFGVWDIFYYIWLKVQLGWPATLLDWDILFLIPLPWLGPVLAPILVSFGLIAGAVVVLLLAQKGRSVLQGRGDWLIVAISGLIIILSFTWDFDALLQQRFPERFHWAIFAAGYILGVGVFVRGLVRSK